MTIVFLCRLFYPHIGGVEKHVREVGRRLVGKGHRLIVVTESSLEVYPKGQNPVLFERIDGMEVYRIPVGENEKRKKWVIWRWMWEHRELLKKADVVHAHDVFFWYLPFRLLSPHKRIFTTFHGYESYPIKWQSVVVRKMSEVLSNGNICIGDFMKKWYKTHPTFVSYGGVDIPSEKVSPSKKDSAVFWGRLDEQTGILTYEAAVNIINKEFTHFSLTVLGEGKLSKKIDQSVKLLGFQENIGQYLNNNHFAFVSRYLSILEAMAFKRLVFAVYDNPVKQDYLRMAAFAPLIVIENSAEKLAEKVIYFLKHPDKEKQMVDEAYQWVRKQKWENVVLVYEKLWDNASKI
jgi:glycosyltransferase involved in cell wall biosynthesis